MGPLELVVAPWAGASQVRRVYRLPGTIFGLETRGFDFIAKIMGASKSAPGASIGYHGSHARIYPSPRLHM